MGICRNRKFQDFVWVLWFCEPLQWSGSKRNITHNSQLTRRQSQWLTNTERHARNPRVRLRHYADQLIVNQQPRFNRVKLREHCHKTLSIWVKRQATAAGSTSMLSSPSTQPANVVILWTQLQGRIWTNFKVGILLRKWSNSSLEFGGVDRVLHQKTVSA